jgi:hypothetical protein
MRSCGQHIEKDILAMIVTFAVFGISAGYFVISMSAHRCTESHFHHDYSSKVGNFTRWECDKREWTRSKPDQDFMSSKELEKMGIGLKCHSK